MCEPRRSIAAAIFALLCMGIASASTTVVHDTTLVPYTVVNGTIPRSLTGVPGNPAAGLAIVKNRKLGNCIACHSMPIAKEAFPGNVGPNLKGVGGYLSVAQLRLRIVNAKLINPDTIMPAYYRVAGLTDVAKKFVGKPILTAQQVEDVVAYLSTLK